MIRAAMQSTIDLAIASANFRYSGIQLNRRMRLLQVLGRNNSINVRKVLWTCAALNLPFENEPWGVPPMLLADPQFLNLNPNALVPVLKDRDFVLWESNSIIRYLANKYNGAHLYPAEAQARAEVDRWIDWQATELNQAWMYTFMALVRNSPAHADGEALRKSQDSWTKQMRIIEQQITRTGAYIAGGQFSLADIPVALSVNRWFSTPFKRVDLPAVAAYFERLQPVAGFTSYCANGMP